jgi:hypothetical protein
MHDRVERIESVKAGCLSGLAAGIGYGAISIVGRLLSQTTSRSILGGESLSLLSLGLTVAIAISGGFLFGVTYRYIIRTDRNDHLKSGAVLAFGLVRGLAQVDVRGLDLVHIGWNGLVIIENIWLFLLARYTLDYALAVRWILPFKSEDLGARS